MIKRLLKRPVQIATAAVAPRLWRRRRRSLVVLMYHRILPREDRRLRNEQPGMVVHPETLEMQLRWIRQHFEPVRLDHWVRTAIAGGPVPDRACAITFDDGWRDNYEYAFPILVRERVPATIFVVSDRVGTTRGFWPERLAQALQLAIEAQGPDVLRIAEFAWLRELGVTLGSRTGGLSRDALDAIIVAAKVLPDAVLDARVDAMLARLGTGDSAREPSLLDWDQVREMTRSGLVAIGSHTRRHVRLGAAIDGQTMEDEIAGSRKIIEGQTGCPADVFCYPNGDTSPAAVAMVKRNYLAACSTRRGWHTEADDRFLIRRIGVHQDISADRSSFLARVSGWL